jgi:hypothetical protein
MMETINGSLGPRETAAQRRHGAARAPEGTAAPV